MYEATDGTAPRWNLFARELEDILAERGLRLGHLDNRKDAYGEPLVHREKVRRLQRSLRTPKAFTILNPDELQRVITTFQLTQHEQIRLYAAVLATSVEVTLMDRIHLESALRASEQILPILQQALEAPAAAEALLAVRGGAAAMNPDSTDDTTELDMQCEKALDAFDRATLALHMSRTSKGYQEQIERAQQALDGFRLALRLLEKADARLRADEGWQLWHAEAELGEATSIAVLTEFGIQPNVR
jgi:hypothetical protein